MIGKIRNPSLIVANTLLSSSSMISSVFFADFPKCNQELTPTEEYRSKLSSGQTKKKVFVELKY